MAEVRAGCQTTRVGGQGRLLGKLAEANALPAGTASRRRPSGCARNFSKTSRMRACTSSSGFKMTSPAGPRARPTGNPCRSSPRSADVACSSLHPLFELVELRLAQHSRHYVSSKVNPFDPLFDTTFRAFSTAVRETQRHPDPRFCEPGARAMPPLTGVGERCAPRATGVLH